MSLKDIARTYRLQMDLNQKTMAARVGCSQATYCKFEAGTQRLREQYLIKILKIVLPNFTESLDRAEAIAELYLTGRDSRGRVIKQVKKGKSICLD